MVWDEVIQLPQKKLNLVLIGEIVIDTIIHKDSLKTSKFIGGSPFNICKNLTRLKIKNHFFGAVGNDKCGREVLKQIEKLGIQASINLIDQKTSSVTVDQTISSPLPVFHRSADTHIPLSMSLIEHTANAKLLHFTYWPLSGEPSRQTILSLLDEANANNTLVGFDPNYHPLLDDDQQSGLKLIKDLIHRVDIIKPSLDDSIRIFGEKTVEEYLATYEGLGAKLIFMTLGKDGLVARYKGETLRMPTMAKVVVDATGAGDAFWSGLYAGILKGKTIRESIVLGLTASSYKMKSIGSEFDVSEFQKHLEG
jgi:fructokinase